jgi:hypothetical protein
MMKRIYIPLAVALLLVLGLAFTDFPTTIRIPGGSPQPGMVLTATNADGSCIWSNVITGTTITADTFNMTATDSSWSIMEGDGDSMNFSNDNSGLWLELGVASGTRMRRGFQTPSNVWAASIIATNDLFVASTLTVSNSGSAYMPSNGFFMDVGAKQYRLATRASVTSIPVPFMQPTANGGIAFDIMPKGLMTADILGAGIAWFDVVAEDLYANPASGYHSLRGAAHTNFLSIGSVSGSTNWYPLNIHGTNIVMTRTVGLPYANINNVVEIVGTMLTPTTRPYGLLNLVDDSTLAADTGGGVLFSTKYTASATTDIGSIRAGKDNATSGQYGGYLALHTRTDGSGNDAERVRISSIGRVQVLTESLTVSTNVIATNSVMVANQVTAPYGLLMQGAQIWSDGTNLLVCLRNSGGTIVTNKLTMSAWP